MHGLMLALRASALFHCSPGSMSRAGGSTCSRLAAGFSRFWARVSRLANDLSSDEAGVSGLAAEFSSNEAKVSRLAAEISSDEAGVSREFSSNEAKAVSYTHLTLPTKA